MTDPKKPVVTEPKSVDNNSVPVKKSKDTGQEDKIAEYKPYYGMLHSHTGHLYLQGECPKDCNPEGNNECSRPPREVFYVEKDKTTKKVIFAGFKAIPHAQGCPMNAFKVASRAGLDFIALTEHSNSFTDETWERQGEMTQKYSSNNPEFLALRGMELTFPGTSIGHLNTFNTTDYATRYSVSQKYDLASWVKQEITCIVQDPEKAEAIYTMLNNDIAEVKSHLNDTKKIEDSMLQNKAMKTKYNSFKTAMGSGGKIEEFYSNELYGRIEAYLMEAYNYFFKKKGELSNVDNYILTGVVLRLMEIHSKNPDRQMKIYNDMFPRSMINKTEVSGVINKFKKDIKNSKDSLSNVILENIRVEKNKMLETINKLRIPMLSNRTVKGILSDREHVGWEEVSKKIITSKRKTLAVELLGWQLNPNKSVKVKGEMIKKDAKIVQILCLAEYYAWIAAQKDSITQLNHPCKAFGDFMGFAYYGSVINDKGTKLSVAKNVHLVELAACDVAGAKVFNVGYGERYEDALQNGWLVAPTFDQDNHHQCWGSCNDLRTVALIKSYPKTPFNKTTLYDAIRKRHIYATDSKTLQLDFRVKAGNEVNTEDIAIMGDILDRPRSKITVYIKASNREHKINEILISGPQYRIIKPNRYFNSKALNDIKAKEEKGNKGFQLLMCEITVTKIDYIYLVVSMEDNRYAFSVPIWINYKKPTDQAILNQL